LHGANAGGQQGFAGLGAMERAGGNVFYNHTLAFCQCCTACCPTISDDLENFEKWRLECAMSYKLQSIAVEQLDIPHVSVRDIDRRIKDLLQKLAEIGRLH
jgi:hypothetical protein